MSMTKHGYEQTSVEEIRSILRDKWSVTDEEILKGTKTKLVELLLKLEGKPAVVEAEEESQEQTVVEEDNDVDDVFDSAIEEDTGILAVEEQPENNSTPVPMALPAYGSQNWNEYVLNQFRDDELKDGNPTCDGCRRVAEQLIGPIMSSDIASYNPPNKENMGTATVVVCLVVRVTNESHPLYGNNISVSEIADVNSENTDAPYHKHPSATAATRAEGRALRKLLRLSNVITADEASKKATEEDNGLSWEPDDPITDSQINTIDMLCGTSRLNISVMDFVNSGRRTYTDVREVNQTTASKMIQELNKIQRQQKQRPAGISSYNPNWRGSK